MAGAPLPSAESKGTSITSTSIDDLQKTPGTHTHINTYPQTRTTKLEDLNREGSFPPLDGGLGRVVVWNCWEGKYETVVKVVDNLEALEHLL